MEPGRLVSGSRGPGGPLPIYPGQVSRRQVGPAPAVAPEIEGAIAELTQLYSEVSGATPWRCPNAEAWDALTFQSWIEARIDSQVGREFFRFLTNQAFSTEAEQISLLQMLWFAQTSHGLPPWALGGAQANRVAGGTQLVAERLAASLGNVVHLRQVVREIEQDERSVGVRTADAVYRLERPLSVYHRNSLPVYTTSRRCLPTCTVPLPPFKPAIP